MLTIDVKDLLLCILIIVLIVLAINALFAVYNLIKTLKQSQKLLSDFETVGEIASKRTKQLDKLIDDASTKIKAGQNIFSSVPIIFSVIGKIAKAVGQKNGKSE